MLFHALCNKKYVLWHNLIPFLIVLLFEGRLNWILLKNSKNPQWGLVAKGVNILKSQFLKDSSFLHLLWEKLCIYFYILRLDLDSQHDFIFMCFLVEPDREKGFHLDVEDYLSGVLILASELVSSVTCWLLFWSFCFTVSF